MTTTTAAFTSPEKLQQTLNCVRASFNLGKTRDIRWRKQQLKQLFFFLQNNEDAIVEAMMADLHKPHHEVIMAESGTIRAEILHVLKHLEEYMEDVVPGNALAWVTGTKVRKEPIGVTLIIGAWNFPFYTLIGPLVNAIAAGCAIILKPSELSPHSAALIESKLNQYLDESAIRVITAGPAEMKKVLEMKIDHIFFTGSPTIGKIVSEAAGKNLIPVTMELGGQGPVVIGKSANLDVAAKNIAWGKFMNAGQVCLSPNHVFIAPDRRDEFVQKLIKTFEAFKAGGKDEMVRIVNERNFDRLTGLVEKSKGKIAYSGGASDRATRAFYPTIITDINTKDSSMSQEIFGPILPIISADVDQAIKEINSFEHPLSLYVFSNDSKEVDHVINNTRSGGVTVNDIFTHAQIPDAPFGGIGNSGSGSCHGIFGFNAFSHFRTVSKVPTWLDRFLGFKFPPYDSSKTAQALKFTLGKPNFKLNESLEDQEVSFVGKIAPKLLRLGSSGIVDGLVRWILIISLLYQFGVFAKLVSKFLE